MINLKFRCVLIIALFFIVEQAYSRTPEKYREVELINAGTSNPDNKTGVESWFVPHFSRLGEGERKQWDFIGRRLIVDFRVSHTEIDAGFLSNESVLKEIVDAVTLICKNTDNRLSKIQIEGYASPEGLFEYNETLSKNRAGALKRYLQRKIQGFRLNDDQFSVTNGGENWLGLREMVAASDMENKKEVLHILDDVLNDRLNPETAKDRLKQLKNGEPYRYMLNNFYPLLRNACYVAVNYELINEPAIGMINEAIGFIGEKEYGKALELLLPATDDPRTWNAIGICYMMTGKGMIARFWFGKAVEAGNSDAKKNLDQLDAKNM